MKKWIVVPIALIAVALLAIYIFVPKKISLSQSITINCTHGAANRYLVNNSNWVKWWPDDAPPSSSWQGGGNTYTYKNYLFQPQQSMFDAIRIHIIVNDVANNSKIVLIPKNKDSVSVQWNVDYYTGDNPLTRVQRYFQAGTLREDIKEILVRMKSFLEKTGNVYGIDVKKTIVQDSLLLTTKKVFVAEPSTQDIYSLLNKLKAHIQQQGATATGYPMMNIQRKNNTLYETMVAIPVNKAIKAQNDMAIKNLVQGHILVTEVSGGVHTVSNAFAQLENYLRDHQYESPAIPFYSLITDRTTETDTSKWITRISYPVL